jgi:hypothetical protein
MNNHLLQKLMPTEDYLAIAGQKPVTRAEYEPLIPTYKVAECLFCRADCLARLDTYSLLRWSPIGTPANMWGFTQSIVNRCPHVIMGEFFINLNGLLPTEMDYFDTRSEIPFVNPRLVDDVHWESSYPDMNPYAIMHAWPICRIERKLTKRHLVPRYSLFTITYFARHYAPMYDWWMKGFKYQWMQRAGKYDDEWWDLNGWVAQGKLLWLDPSKPKLPVQQYPDSFPYSAIKGYRADQIIYRKGKISDFESGIYDYR